MAFNSRKLKDNQILRESMRKSVIAYLKQTNQNSISKDQFKTLINEHFPQISDKDIELYFEYTFTENYNINSKYCLGQNKKHRESRRNDTLSTDNSFKF